MKHGCTILNQKQSGNQWNGTMRTRPKKKKEIQMSTFCKKSYGYGLFFYSKGLLHVDIMPQGTTINSNAYVATLKKLQATLSCARPHL
jgi:hypothetical protein